MENNQDEPNQEDEAVASLRRHGLGGISGGNARVETVFDIGAVEDALEGLAVT